MTDNEIAILANLIVIDLLFEILLNRNSFSNLFIYLIESYLS